VINGKAGGWEGNKLELEKSWGMEVAHTIDLRDIFQKDSTFGMVGVVLRVKSTVVAREVRETGWSICLDTTVR